MDPRIREDDGEKRDSYPLPSFLPISVIPAHFRHSCLLPSFLPISVIPAKAGIHPLHPPSAEVKKPHLFLSNKVRLLPLTGLGFRLYFLAGSSGFLSLPSMYGLHGLAFTGPGVFHTTLN